ncbi:MAG: DUF4870 domain-containing protein [Pseudomonadota bacterium]|jgi:uncharacterized protein|uniref:DUF4870 domain-containing protein n=1 Tax=Alcanivorax sp. TaxID=1872427 RepID=UPI00243EBAE8|nr:DUF4870 domain-containing protein [Alcanivorax sp.]MED5238087.1 DUF4870 domain-containing protein [Pseudomonadota bacterium]MEE3321052.1 DUF4870 domain-containing protein [Pseudomonadota bacterium]
MTDIEKAQDATTQQAGPGKEERSQAMACHLLALIGFVIPFGNLVGPLIMWVVKKDESSFVDDQGKEAVNFNITILIAFFVSFLLTFVVIGAILMPIIGLFWLVMTIIAGLKANEGVTYRYPLTLRLIN